MAMVQREVVEEHPIQTVQEAPVSPAADHGMNVVARIISLVGGVIMALLGIRFVLVLLGANPANAFANFIYDVSQPFVKPFFGLFSYDPTLGTARFEYETLIAIVVYGLVTWLLVRLVTIGKR